MPSSLGNAYTDMDDLFTQWFSFATSNGWTQDLLDLTPALPGLEAALHKGTIFAQWIFDSGNARLFHFQSLAYNGSSPGNNPDDAGPFGTIPSQQRATIIGNGAGTADFFQGTENGAEFLFCVAEESPDLFRMWGLGSLIKVGDWTGGEWVASQSWPIHGSVFAQQDAAFDSRNKTLFDGRHGQGGQGCTLHLEGFHGLVGKWGMMGSSASPASDRSNTARAVLEGPGRDGPWFQSLNYITAQPNTGFLPLQPYPIHLRTGGQWTLLGFAPGIRGLRITFISPREEFTLGADVWKAYPWVKKSFANAGGPESDDQGLAILKTP